MQEQAAQNILPTKQATPTQAVAPQEQSRVANEGMAQVGAGDRIMQAQVDRMLKKASFRNSVANAFMTPEDKKFQMQLMQQRELARERMSTADRIEEQKLLRQAEKAERPFYEQTMKDKKSAGSSLKEIDRTIELIQSGKVSNPTEDSFQRWMSSALKINLSDLRGADTEEFDKLTTGFVKNAKSWFGSRVTNADLKVFMKTIPQLSMTNEGKLRLLGAMKSAAQAQEVRYEAMKDLMAKNGGHLPAYAEMQVEEMVGPELDRLAKSFISGEAFPKLSKEAEAANTRNRWMRWMQGALSGGGKVAEVAGAGTKALGNVMGSLAGLPID
jgi:hypothetical protein